MSARPATGAAGLAPAAADAVGLAGLFNDFVEFPALPGVLRVHFGPLILIVTEGIVHNAFMPRTIRKAGAELTIGLLPGGGEDLHPAVLIGEAGIGAESEKITGYDTPFYISN